MKEPKNNAITDTPANVDASTLSEMKSTDGQADIPLDRDASAEDLDHQLTNEMANDAISKMIDTSQSNGEQSETRIKHDYTNPETLTVGDMAMMPLSPTGDKKASARANFIPNATTNIPDEETMFEVAETL